MHAALSAVDDFVQAGQLYKELDCGHHCHACVYAAQHAALQVCMAYCVLYCMVLRIVLCCIVSCVLCIVCPHPTPPHPTPYAQILVADFTPITNPSSADRRHLRNAVDHYIQAARTMSTTFGCVLNAAHIVTAAGADDHLEAKLLLTLESCLAGLEDVAHLDQGTLHFLGGALHVVASNAATSPLGPTGALGPPLGVRPSAGYVKYVRGSFVRVLQQVANRALVYQLVVEQGGEVAAVLRPGLLLALDVAQVPMSG